MKVINIHKRVFNQPKEKLVALMRTLSTENDKVWPQGKWPAMRFKGGIKEGAKGGHGPIRYTVNKYDPQECAEFQFYSPKGFNGIHRFDIIAIDTYKTELRHTIDMKAEGLGAIKWILGVRWLHDALAEDALDAVENQLFDVNKKTAWNPWVKLLRKLLK